MSERAGVSDPTGELTNDPITADEAPAAAEAPKPAAAQPRDEHGHFLPKPEGSKRRRGRSSSKPAVAPASDAELEELRAMLKAQMREVAPLNVLPTAAEVWAERAEGAVDNLVVLAQRFPSLRQGLASGVLVFAGLGLVNFGSAVGYAAACDLGFADPEAAMAQRMGITQAYYRVHPEILEEEQGVGAPVDNGQGPAAAEGARPARGRGYAIPSILGDVPGGAA